MLSQYCTGTRPLLVATALEERLCSAYTLLSLRTHLLCQRFCFAILTLSGGAFVLQSADEEWDCSR